ncbi:hypothetical protein JXJ21_05425 [candidate division KSB1 bacterium]|nr:hypothetical protein [candidate division KSB1 bacterium]
MCESARKLRDTYARKPGAPFFRKTFGLWMCIDHWYENGLARDTDLDQFFMFDPPGHFALGQLGWCSSALCPAFEEKIIESCGNQEIVQDPAGRHVLYFTGRRQGFMPEYLKHPVIDFHSWQEKVKWRLNPDSSERTADLSERMGRAREAAARGLMIQQNLIGGYMYLRSLIGPEDLLFFFYDQPELIHECMRTWFELADAVIACHQRYVTLDEVYFAEDICYNHGSLISPEMMRTFLLPYYQQLVENIKQRQIDKTRHLYIQIDTDGYAVPVIEVYQGGIGMDVMSPFEVASGCDVVQIGRQYPELVMSGGIDKRILARGKEAIDAHLEYILPIMRERGGYIPTCDHGVPEEVSWENYLHYRKRCVELGG